MKQLDLSGYGVAEMQWDEMRETDGGHPVIIGLGTLLEAAAALVATATVTETIAECMAHSKAFIAGYTGKPLPKN